MCPRLVFAAAMALTASGGAVAVGSGQGTAVAAHVQQEHAATGQDWSRNIVLTDDLAMSAPMYATTIAAEPLRFQGKQTAQPLRNGPYGSPRPASAFAGSTLPAAYRSGRSPAASQGDPSDPQGRHLAIALMPVTASYRVTRADHPSVPYGIPQNDTGHANWHHDYDDPGFWTLTPKLGFAQMVPSADPQSSTVVSVNVFSAHSNLMYVNTATGRIEALLMRQTPNGWGFGGVAAAIEQFSQDPGSFSNRTPYPQSNNGMGLGVGPQVTWGTHWLGGNVQFGYRWIHELHGPGGRTIQPMLLSATVRL
jgi:hypothetical protein